MKTTDPTTTPTKTASPTPTSTPTATPTPLQRLIIPSGDTETVSAAVSYEAVEWYNTGRLVIEQGGGLGLLEGDS